MSTQSGGMNSLSGSAFLVPAFSVVGVLFFAFCVIIFRNYYWRGQDGLTHRQRLNMNEMARVQRMRSEGEMLRNIPVLWDVWVNSKVVDGKLRSTNTDGGGDANVEESSESGRRSAGSNIVQGDSKPLSILVLKPSPSNSLPSKPTPKYVSVSEHSSPRIELQVSYVVTMPHTCLTTADRTSQPGLPFEYAIGTEQVQTSWTPVPKHAKGGSRDG